MQWSRGASAKTTNPRGLNAQHQPQTPAPGLAVSAGLLAITGPASAAPTDQAKAAPPTGVGSSFLDIGTAERLDLNIASSEVFELNTVRANDVPDRGEGPHR
jgi:hypothetical protein